MSFPEVHWRDRLKVIDFEVIRAQIARKLGIKCHEVSEVDVRLQMEEIYARDHEDAKRAHPEDFRPQRTATQ
ncbi:MAG: hypothetical protein ACOY3M_02500 [Patescibacteria group bacterium]|jgi:hypothetical protein